MLKGLKYYFFATYRRKILDKLLEQNRQYYQGRVLDIGGRDRGKFQKPKQKVGQWIFADIVKENNPDILLDVADMRNIATESIDVILATELFEHVENVKQGLRECFRVLKNNRVMILSAPFLYRVHADPYDFQRWTSIKWEKEVTRVGFNIEKFVIMGRYFTVLSDMKKELVKSMPKIFKIVFFLFYPLFDLVVLLDKLKIVKKSRLGKFHGGYFMVLRKPIYD